MTREQFIKGLETTYTECLNIVKAKNKDYATDTDPWKNFRFANMVGVEYKRAILVRMSDKLARISNILDKEVAVKDEDVQDTLKDLINYSAILREAIKNE